ncbi:MAG: capsular biosynthesis protein [Clostridia bacterium]|nr:capsular biosynthesis protein [Clostridia bacterium]
MTDLHCHILPGIDDGAKDVDMALDLLQQEQDQGVTNLVFTSHFYPDRSDFHEFLQKRHRAFGSLMEAVEQEGHFRFNYKLGAEVRFSPKLTELPVEKLCFTGTPYLLLEFPFSREPAFFDEVLFDLRTRGIRPIIAHIERYSWLKDRPDRLYSWVDSGLLLQANATPLLEGGEDGRSIKKLIDWNLVKVLSSDAHHPERRPANLGTGIIYVADTMGNERARELLQNGNRIFKGEEVIARAPIEPHKRLGKWV